MSVVSDNRTPTLAHVQKEQRSARTPSWTDRVLVRRPMEWPGFPLEDVEYTSVDQVRYSDHAPVRAIMKLTVSSAATAAAGNYAS